MLYHGNRAPKSTILHNNQWQSQKWVCWSPSIMLIRPQKSAEWLLIVCCEYVLERIKTQVVGPWGLCRRFVFFKKDYIFNVELKILRFNQFSSFPLIRFCYLIQLLGSRGSALRKRMERRIGVARVPCALGQEIFLRLLSTKITEFEVKNRCKSVKEAKTEHYCSYFVFF